MVRIGFCFWLAGALLSGQTAYVVRTIVGHDAGGDGGLATNALVPFPTKVVTDAAGNAYVSEISGPIRSIGADGVITTIATATNPYGLALDGSGNLYIAQNGTCVISRLNLQTGALTTVAGNGKCVAGPDGPASSTSFFVPESLVFDSQGRLIVAEQYSYRIRRIDLTAGTVTTIAGTGSSGATGDGGPATAAQIGTPADLARDSLGNIFFPDSVNCVIRKIDTSGVIHTVAGTAGKCAFAGDGGSATAATLNGPRSVAVSPDGSVLYEGETGSFRVRQIHLDTNKITTYAGTGVEGLSGDGGPATQAKLGWPWGLAFDKSGNLLEADYLDSRVRMIDSLGNIKSFAGTASDSGDGGPAIAATLNGPDAAVPDGKGGLIISDSANRKIRQVTPPGVISLVAGTNFFDGTTGDGGPAKNAGLGFAYGLTADSTGTIYFTEALGNARKISNGIISEITTTSLNFPVAIAVDPTRTYVYVTEYSGARIVRLEIATGIATTFAGLGAPGTSGSGGYDGDGPANQHKLNTPGSVAVDGSGNVYVLDNGNYLIRRINPSSGAMTTVAGNRQNTSAGDGGPATAASITNLSGLAVDTSGNIFFSEGAKIRRVDGLTGTISTIAGTGTAGFAGDGGPALKAQLVGANGMSVDSLGNIYFADGNRIRVLSAPIAGPRIDAAVVAANFGGGVSIAPGTWLEIYGEKLAPTTQTWATSDFNGNVAPNSLGGVKILVGGQPAFIDVISPGQVNAQVPDGAGSGNVTVQVVNPTGSSDPVVMTAADRSPALLAPPSFTSGGRYFAAALYTDGTFAGKANLVPGGSFRPGHSGDTVILYGVGFGGVSPVTPPGTIATQATSLPSVVVTLGGVNAPVFYAGQAGNFVGLDQIYVTVPSGVSGDLLLGVSVNGLPIQQVLFLTVQ
jgi:uncharacterized protein (TIGR03437 family)